MDAHALLLQSPRRSQCSLATMLALKGPTMRRRDFVRKIQTKIILALGLSLLTAPTSLEAQKAAGMSRVGWLEVCGPGPKRPHFETFRAHLGELGYVEGKNPTAFLL